jgi:hypothetical protein
MSVAPVTIFDTPQLGTFVVNLWLEITKGKNDLKETKTGRIPLLSPYLNPISARKLQSLFPHWKPQKSLRIALIRWGKPPDRAPQTGRFCKEYG